MPFKKILSDVVGSVDGGVAALFVDHQGEAIEVVGDLPPWDLKVIGAYQGIFLSQMVAICGSLDHGIPRRLKVDWEDSTILNWAIDREYYLVLVLRRGSNEGLAWRALSRARERIQQEM